MARRLVIPKTARSDVWNYFGFEADESGAITDVLRRTVWCRLCDTQLLFYGSTTNLSSHIAKCRKRPKKQSSELTNIPQHNISYTEVRTQDFDNAPQEHDEIEIFQQNQEIEEGGGLDQEVVHEEEVEAVKDGEEELQYCMKWKFHHSNQLSMFSKLLEKESFCDVTIACEEKLFRAHKLVLSACSSYFEMVLSRFEDHSPVIILKDVKYEDMVSLMQFMYQGEISIPQSQLPSLLETADLLKIKGLSDMCGEIMIGHSNSEGTEKPSNNGKKEKHYKRSLQDEDILRDVKVARHVNVDVSILPVATESKTSAQNQDNEGIIRLPDFLKGHGNYQDYWSKPWVVKALKAVNDKKMTLKRCSDLLGVGYNSLYSRYRLLHKSLKENPRTYMLKVTNKPVGNIIVRRESTEIDRGGKIVLSRNQISPTSTVLQSVVNLKVDSKTKEEYESKKAENSEQLEIKEPESIIAQDEAFTICTNLTSPVMSLCSNRPPVL